ncbi:MAG: energy-coupling factor transporter ATPase [Actinobacteria bacterium]|nr:energy-coupling factor transporter ATPase [Actinomycetota bacterium]
MPITFDHVTYSYPSSCEPALRDISFTIEDGEFLGIIGHTGSGKSTLIQHINGLLLPSKGSVLVDGMDIASNRVARRDTRRKVGLVFQYPEYQLFADTVKADVGFGPRNLGLGEEEIITRVRQALARVGLSYEECAEKSPFDFSGGQRRRIALAGILAMQPSVLVLDEPMAGLDPRGRENIMRFICSLHEEGMTIVMVSHNMEDVAVHATRVITLKKGEILMQGTPREVFSHPKELRDVGLGVPLATAFATELNECGFALPAGIFTLEELADAVAAELGGVVS